MVEHFLPPSSAWLLQTLSKPLFLLLPQQRLLLLAFVLCKLSCHCSICRVPVERFEHLYRCAHVASLVDAFVQAESRIGVDASRRVENRSNAGWSCHSTA